MSSPVFHRFGPYGPVCGTARGVNAADFDPPEITCRRCCKTPPSPFERTQTVRRDGRLFLCSMEDAQARGGSLYVFEGAI